MNVEGPVNSLCSAEGIGDHTIHSIFLDQAMGASDEIILDTIKVIKPDVVLYIGAAGGRVPSIETFWEIRTQAKLVHLCFDAGCPDWHPKLEEYKKAQAFDLTVNIDGNSHWPKNPWDLTLLCPIDATYYKASPVKDIHFGFQGGHASPSRIGIIEALTKQAGLQIGVRNETMGTYQSFADFMLRCQVTLNLGRTGSGQAFHVKSRVLEAGYARCFLFEQAGSPIADWFVPNVDYVSFETADDLTEKLKALTRSEILRVSNNLHMKVTMNYSANWFWSKVIGALK